MMFFYEQMEVIQQLVEKRLTQKEAAVIPGVSERQIMKLLSKYRLAGASDLVSQRCGRASNHQLSSEVKQKGWICYEMEIEYLPLSSVRSLFNQMAGNKVARSNFAKLGANFCANLFH
jgi:Helix-turn-helix domain